MSMELIPYMDSTLGDGISPLQAYQIEQQIGAPPMMDGKGHSTRDFIGSIFNQSAALVRDIFGNRSAPVIQTRQLTDGSYAPVPNNNNSGIGFGIDSQGLRLSSGDHIGWPTMGIAALAFFMIQSKGFQKRR